MSVREVSWKLSVTVFRTQLSVPATPKLLPGQSLLRPKAAAPALGLSPQFELEVPATPKPLPGQSLLKPKAAIPAVRSQHFDLAGADCDALKDEVRDLKRKLSLSQRKVSSLENENKNLRQGISDYLNDDQGYSVARELGIPLPSERTLQRKIEGFKFVPGILSEVIDLLRAKMGQLSGQECHAVLMYDEMQLTKSLNFDSSTNMLLGRPSVPLANSALPESCYATYALVFIL
ncbi:uncharacterized protein LOC144116493 [Amblyomma americanum]